MSEQPENGRDINVWVSGPFGTGGCGAGTERSVSDDSNPSLEDALEYAEEYCPGNDGGQIWPEAIVRLAREVRAFQAVEQAIRALHETCYMSWCPDGHGGLTGIDPCPTVRLLPPRETE